MARLTKYFILMLFSLLVISCSEDSDSVNNTGNENNYNPNGHWSIPTFVSNNFENKYNPSITGDGKTLYCDSYEGLSGYKIYYSNYDGSEWSHLTPLTFSNYTSPCISYDGNTLYFDNGGGTIYRVTKSGGNWTQPDSILAGNNPSITQDGKTLFFTGSIGGFNNGIYYATLENNIWVNKGGITEVNSLGNVSDPGISGDGTLLLFTRSEGYGYKIYYSRKVNNVWQSPQVLSNDINFTDENYTACVSWDKMKLYYSTYTQGGSGPEAGIYMANWVNE